MEKLRIARLFFITLSLFAFITLVSSEDVNQDQREEMYCSAIVTPIINNVIKKSETRPFTLPQVDTFRVDSEILQRQYDISVALPMNYGSSGRKYAALFVLDANLVLATVVETARNFAMLGEAGELIVIGIGCPPEEGLVGFGRRRTFEFTPKSPWVLTGPYAEINKAMIAQMGLDPAKDTGGAPLFLQFLRDELLPMLVQHYRMDLGELGLFGDSAGGSFCLYTLLSGASPFHKYLIGSPATAWCEEELFRIEERYAAANKDLAAQVFIAAGAEEMSNAFIEGGGIVSGVARFCGLFALRHYPSLKVTSYIFPGEGHISVVPGLVSRGLLVLWGTKRTYGVPVS